MAATVASPRTMARDGQAMSGVWVPSTSTIAGCLDRPSTARRMASRVARRIFRRSISSTSAFPSAQHRASSRICAANSSRWPAVSTFRVGQPRYRVVRIQNHRCRHHRPRERSAPGLVHASDPLRARQGRVHGRLAAFRCPTRGNAARPGRRAYRRCGAGYGGCARGRGQPILPAPDSPGNCSTARPSFSGTASRCMSSSTSGRPAR